MKATHLILLIFIVVFSAEIAHARVIETNVVVTNKNTGEKQPVLYDTQAQSYYRRDKSNKQHNLPKNYKPKGFTPPAPEIKNLSSKKDPNKNNPQSSGVDVFCQIPNTGISRYFKGTVPKKRKDIKIEKVYIQGTGVTGGYLGKSKLKLFAVQTKASRNNLCADKKVTFTVHTAIKSQGEDTKTCNLSKGERPVAIICPNGKPKALCGNPKKGICAANQKKAEKFKDLVKEIKKRKEEADPTTGASVAKLEALKKKAEGDFNKRNQFIAKLNKSGYCRKSGNICPEGLSVNKRTGRIDYANDAKWKAKKAEIARIQNKIDFHQDNEAARKRATSQRIKNNLLGVNGTRLTRVQKLNRANRDLAYVKPRTYAPLAARQYADQQPSPRRPIQVASAPELMEFKPITQRNIPSPRKTYADYYRDDSRQSSRVAQPVVKKIIKTKPRDIRIVINELDKGVNFDF